MTERPLAGRVAIVTGAGSTIGFGRAMTPALVRAGGRVAMMDVDRQSLSQTADEALSIGGSGCVVPLVRDVSEPADADRVVQTTVRELRVVAHPRK